MVPGNKVSDYLVNEYAGQCSGTAACTITGMPFIRA